VVCDSLGEGLGDSLGGNLGIFSYNTRGCAVTKEELQELKND